MQPTGQTTGLKVNTRTLAQVITSYAAALDDVNKVEAFVSLFLQSVYKKFGEKTVAEVGKYIESGLPPANSNKPKPAVLTSPFLRLLRNNLLKRQKKQ
jgi:hypothetical protein